MRPLIGITTYGEPASYGPEASATLYSALLPMAYARAVNSAGGRAVLIPEDDPGTDVLRALDGLIVTGGADVSPSLYGADPHPATYTRPSRDDSEFVLMTAALDVDLPVLGICRGMQMMVVACGGTLYQHLPDVLAHSGHRSGGPERYTSHGARFEPGSRLFSILGPEIVVNSRHHQGIEDPGKTTPTGWAIHDGAPFPLIEAVEHPDRRFAIGVQWHPEDTDDLRLFAALVQAASP
jgi:putative glutamine amidotransferase